MPEHNGVALRKDFVATSALSNKRKIVLRAFIMLALQEGDYLQIT